MKRSQLALAIAGLMASSASYALVNVTDPAITTDSGRTVSNWASELKATQSSVLTLPGNVGGTGNPLDARIPVGFLVPAGDTRYIRIELSNGAKFNENPSCTVNDTSGSVIPGHLCSKSQGGKGESYVTFSLVATSSAAIAPNNSVTIINSATAGTSAAVGGIRVEDTTKSVQMTYSLHTNKDSAESVSNPNTAKISDFGPFNFINFKPALSTNFTSGKILTSDVKKEFLKFEDLTGVAKDEYAVLGSFSIGTIASNSVLIPDFGATQVTSATLVSGGSVATAMHYLVGTGTTLEIASAPAGGFAFIQDVVNAAAAGTYSNAKSNGSAGGSIFFTTSEANCITTPTSAANPKDVNGDKAVFSLDDMRTGGAAFVCVKANKLTTISAAEFGVVINPASMSNSAPSKTSSFAFNPIKQNGTVLDTPYFTNLPTTQYGSRVILSNTSTTKVPYKISVISTDGVTVTPGTVDGEIPPQSLKKIEIKDVVATLSAGNNGALRITLTGANSWLSGVYQTIKKRTDGTTGDIQSIPLIRQGGAAAGTAP